MTSLTYFWLYGLPDMPLKKLMLAIIIGVALRLVLCKLAEGGLNNEQRRNVQ